MNKLLYVFLLATGTSSEITHALGSKPGVFDMIYSGAFIYILLSKSLPTWIWKKGWMYIGVASLFIELLKLIVIASHAQIISVIGMFFNVALLLICLQHLQKNQHASS